MECECDKTGSMDSECDSNTSQCVCKSNYAGLRCDKCSNGYFNYPLCDCKIFLFKFIKI